MPDLGTDLERGERDALLQRTDRQPPLRRSSRRVDGQSARLGRYHGRSRSSRASAVLDAAGRAAASGLAGRRCRSITLERRSRASATTSTRSSTVRWSPSDWKPVIDYVEPIAGCSTNVAGEVDAMARRGAAHWLMRRSRCWPSRACASSSRRGAARSSPCTTSRFDDRAGRGARRRRRIRRRASR